MVVGERTNQHTQTGRKHGKGWKLTRLPSIPSNPRSFSPHHQDPNLGGSDPSKMSNFIPHTELSGNSLEEPVKGGVRNAVHTDTSNIALLPHATGCDDTVNLGDPTREALPAVSKLEPGHGSSLERALVSVGRGIHIIQLCHTGLEPDPVEVEHRGAADVEVVMAKILGDGKTEQLQVLLLGEWRCGMSTILGSRELVESQRLEEKRRRDPIPECFGNAGLWRSWGVLCHVVENSNGTIGLRGRGGVDACVILDTMADGNLLEGEARWW